MGGGGGIGYREIVNCWMLQISRSPFSGPISVVDFIKSSGWPLFLLTNYIMEPMVNLKRFFNG